MIKAMNKAEFADMVWSAEDNKEINFYEEYDKESDDPSGGYCVKSFIFADAKMIIASYYGGGGLSFCMDVSWERDDSDFTSQYISFLNDCGFKDEVYVELEDEDESSNM